MTLPETIREYLGIINKNGYEAYAVGGCVRDILMGREPQDYDVTASALPEEVINIFSGEKVIETGMKHGTVTVIYKGIKIETTTFRSDGVYLDSRHPDNVTFGKSLEEDTARRDFTINAIAADRTGKIYDYHGGAEDIKNGIIRCVGDPAKRFSEDALRILRALRFASRLGFDIEEKTGKALVENADLLGKISAERIREEINGILCGEHAEEVLTEFPSVLFTVLPELEPMYKFNQNSIYHIYDVYTHTLKVVGGLPPLSHLRLTGLLHDSGKPASYTVGEDGYGHFFGHPAVSEKIAAEILRRLKYDNDTARRVKDLVREHDRQINEEKKAVKKVMAKYGADFFFDLMEIKRADNRAQNPEFNVQSHIDKLQKIAEEIIKEGEALTVKDLEINGSDLIAAGYKGREIGEKLSELLGRVIEGEIKNEREELLKNIKE